MILRVLEICNKLLNRKNIFVATDNDKIKKFVKSKNFNVIMTSKNCRTGTDRVAEATKKIKSKIIINVQGDEPNINHNDIKKVISAKKKFPNHVICGYTPITKYENPNNINLPKVAINKKSDLVYISRLPVPGLKNTKDTLKYYKQVCIYGFNKKQLLQFKKFGKRRSRLESSEDIEILRFFELNIPIKMIRLSSSSIAVDVKSDIKKLEKYLKKR
jgi:3-deoxy-manno-octulosonate cytidylyltransferase (CMP-KDO synthetase)